MALTSQVGLFSFPRSILSRQHSLARTARYCYCASAHYACRGRYCFGKSACPLVRLSHCGTVSKRMYISSNTFNLLVGAWPQFYKIPRETASTRVLNIRVLKRIANFDGKRCLFRKRYERGPWLRWIIDRSVSVPMILSNLERQEARG